MKYMKDFNGEKVFSLEYDKTTLTDMVCELQEKYESLLTDYRLSIEKRVELEQEIERLNNKLLLIKGIIRTPRALDSLLAYAMVKTQIENVLGSDKE